MIAMPNILTQLDQLNVQQQPYSDHYALKYDENTRTHYSALFLMALLQEGAISEQQQRMLDLWLPAIGLAGRQVELCEMAARLAQSGLAEAIKLVHRDEQLANALLLDMMIFSRVAKPLSDSTIQLLEALAGFFKLTERSVSDIVYFAAFILGLNVDRLQRPDAELSLDAYSVYAEFLYDLPTLREKRLFAWVRENDLQSIIPCYPNQLTEVYKLQLEKRHFPLPAEIALLKNLDDIIISTFGIDLDHNSLPGLKHVKSATKLQLTTFFDRDFRTLPDEIMSLDLLTEIQLGWISFDYMSDTIKSFVKNKNINIVTNNEKTFNFFK